MDRRAGRAGRCTSESEGSHVRQMHTYWHGTAPFAHLLISPCMAPDTSITSFAFLVSRTFPEIARASYPHFALQAL